ncbi:MAG: DUF3379 family protein [Pseudomonadota bacterium]|nr:DUF3379 family protein [Pseudomonadota bacterium]
MMDDSEFRQRCLEDPDCQDPEFLQKSRETPENAALLRSCRELDRKIRGVANDIDPPPGLNARIRERVAEAHRPKRSRRVSAALASAAGIVALLGVMLWVPAGTDPIGDVVLSHVNRELHHLSDQENVSPERLSRLLADYGTSLHGDLGMVSFASACAMRKRKGVHLVVQGERGPITVLVMPGERVGGRQVFEDTRFTGVILPMTVGAAAIVGERGEPLGTFEQRLRNVVAGIT